MAAVNNFFRFAVAILFVTLVRAIFKRHPTEPGMKAEVPHCRNGQKNSPSVPAATCNDQIRWDRRIKSLGVSPAQGNRCYELLAILRMLYCAEDGNFPENGSLVCFGLGLLWDTLWDQYFYTCLILLIASQPSYIEETSRIKSSVEGLMASYFSLSVVAS